LIFAIIANPADNGRFLRPAINPARSRPGTQSIDWRWDRAGYLTPPHEPRAPLPISSRAGVLNSADVTLYRYQQ
jgi:hypothetical protein